MKSRCRCGHALADPFGELGCVELGCIECGRACCPTCGVWLESVMYCVFCASAFRDLPHGTSDEVALATLLTPEHCEADASAIRP